jgi:alkylhydroperoxidase family enzyme
MAGIRADDAAAGLGEPAELLVIQMDHVARCVMSVAAHRHATRQIAQPAEALRLLDATLMEDPIGISDRWGDLGLGGP